MIKLVCASALLALAGAAQGAAFETNSVACGVLPGDLGNPITWTHPTNAAPYNNATVSGVFGPSADLIDGIPAAAYDSYLGMDPVGPSEPGTTSSGDGYNTNTNLGTTSAGVGFGVAGQVQGGWFSTAKINSGADGRLFVLQLSLRPNSSVPTTTGVSVNIIDAGTSSSGSLGLVKFGSANANNNGGAWAQSYYLDVETRTISGVSTAFNGGTTYDIYLVAAVPAPGVAGLAGLAGVAAIRRRRA